MIIIESKDILAPIRIKAKEYFSRHIITEAEELLRLSRITVSFMRGRSNTYFIVSGIVNENRAHETKIVYKTNPDEILNSNCDCLEWNEKHHCRHAASLFFYYHLNKTLGPNERKHFINVIRDNSNLGVTPFDYGTIIRGPQKFHGSPPNATYSTLNYILSGNEIINFPLPISLNGKIIINAEMHSGNNQYASLKFMFEDIDGHIVRNISILENMYLFNWDSGIVYHIPIKLKSIFKKISVNDDIMTLSEIIPLIRTKNFSHLCVLYINDLPIQDVNLESSNLRLTLNQSTRKGHIELAVQFHDQDENILPLPYFMHALTFIGGHLNSFKRKKDAYKFLDLLCTYFMSNRIDYKKSLYGNTEKDFWLDIINQTSTNLYCYNYSQEKKSLIEHSNHLIKLLIELIIDLFKVNSFRFAEFNELDQIIYFHIPTSNIFHGLSEFHKKLSPYGTSIYYNKNEISAWKSKIRFERRPSFTSWFNLNLDITNEDLEIIKNSDLDQGLALTKKGLVLFTDEQKNLVKFMRKYTRFEADDQDITKDDSGNTINRFHIPFNKARIFELFELKKMGIEGALTKEEENICYRLATLESIPKYPIPANLENILRPYQKTGFHWLNFLYEHKMGACLADDMGLGKTIQVIALIKSNFDKIKRVLIVCPVTIILNWEKEIEKFSDMKAYIYHGGSRSIPDNAKIILTSYGIMKKEVESTFKNELFDILILDEVQQLKNIRSQGAIAARKINADFRICLTGTPVENDLSEFYNIIDLSIPGVWGDLQFFRTTSTSKTRQLARKTASPFILRRTKSQVLTELPPKQENTIYLNFDEREKQLYDTKLLSIKNRIIESPKRKKYGEILKGLLELRQQCLWGNKNQLMQSTKIEFLVETLEQIVEEGHQAIIFSQFTTYLNIIQKHLEAKHWKLARIDGTQTIKKRQQQVDLFQDGKKEIFLISLKAGGVGLNLTAASYVFVMDPWWNPAVECQAIDRAHRIGQKNTLTVYRLIIKDSVEEKVLKLQEYKKELFLDLLPENDDQYFTGKLSMKDFSSMFEEDI